ncbi:hypothetical protein COEREDRAFT_83980 [Coemansia reversa NRRL 1564]|uniref:Nudix hydrolase domain-containing protein n=1 Tax=Coemansia reversa (strain ATCC 12441 / NRRL 1564) TaxID=763665 RepID=A0A2G5B0W1_COERN|nr:hypothetical protein COEREDRAFT_83980 [Coemansia reversa NRRL 1564]|eukprot:PIA12658.1 hypothetical protein COEREDRAFT_83980 [Coemansia reversa NRRL 1564]
MPERGTILSVVHNCNNVRDLKDDIACEIMYKFFVNNIWVGVVSKKDAHLIQDVSDAQKIPPLVISSIKKTITFSNWCDTRKKRSDAMATVLLQLREANTCEPLSKWRNELYLVGGDTSVSDGVFFELERAAAEVFGVRTFGVHVNGITVSNAGKVCMWVGRRSLSKQKWPGMLDQIAAGGIGNGVGVWDSMIKECDEEANIPSKISQKAKYAGTIQYFTRTEVGMQPETQFVFDLVLPEKFVPTPKDGEVDTFYLWTLDEVIDKIKQNQFKPNCAMCIVDFLIRHGNLTPENEPDYLEIIDNLHCSFEFPAPRSFTAV